MSAAALNSVASAVPEYMKGGGSPGGSMGSMGGSLNGSPPHANGEPVGRIEALRVLDEALGELRRELRDWR